MGLKKATSERKIYFKIKACKKLEHIAEGRSSYNDKTNENVDWSTINDNLGTCITIKEVFKGVINHFLKILDGHSSKRIHFDPRRRQRGNK